MAISATISAQFLALAEKQETTVPLMIGHRIMGRTLLGTGDITESRMHCDRTLTLYNLNEHRSLAMRFGQDTRVADLSVRAVTLWLLGYPDAAIADAEYAVKDARELGQATTLMFALGHAPLTYMLCRDYTAANKRLDESIVLADE
jgi:hypothetical protein